MADERHVTPVTNKASIVDESETKGLIGWAVDTYVKPKAMDILRDMLGGMMDMVSDAFLGAIDKKFYGEDGYYPRRTSSGHTNYNKMYDKPVNRPKIQNTANRSVNDFKYIAVEDRQTADRIVQELRESIDIYDKVPVATLYELVNETPSASDWNYGWVDVNDIHYRRRGRDFVFDMPKPIPIKN